MSESFPPGKCLAGETLSRFYCTPGRYTGCMALTCNMGEDSTQGEEAKTCSTCTLYGTHLRCCLNV